MSTLTPAQGRAALPHLSEVTPAEDARTILINNISWSAVFAGVAVALVTTLLLNMLGLGIGVSNITPSGNNNPAAGTLSIAAGVWYLVSSLIAAFFGGHTAARLSGRAKSSTAAWHGLVAWAMTTLVILYLLTTAVGGLIGGAFSTVTGAASGLGQTAATAAGVSTAGGADPFSSIANQLNASGNDTTAMKNAAVAAVKSAVTGDQGQADQARESAAQALAKAQNVSIDEARTRVSQYQQQYQQSLDQAKQKAMQAADTAATVVSRGALFGFVALLLGALAGWFGGRSGEVKPTLTDTVDERARI